MITPERWKRVDEIFHAARARAAADRAAYLAEACGDDESLRRHLDSLLAHGDALSKLASGIGAGSTTITAFRAGKEAIGPYRIEEWLDAGGMGVVYRALDTRLGRQVAIKVGLAHFSDRFHREARAIARLNHVNICTLHDIGSTPEIPGYLVMEFVEGPTLASRLQQGAMTIAEALAIARQIAAGLAAAHAQGIVHRDLKPANVKITPQGVVKVLDFGLATDFPGGMLVHAEEHSAATPGNGMLTVAGTVLGTPSYMSPEQASGQDADARSDVFAFGVVLYEMLCGRRPFAGKNAQEVMASVRRTEPDEPRRLRTAISEPLQRILLKCLRRDPEDRYPSGVELQQDIDALLEASRAGQWLWLRTALTTAAVLLVVAGGYFGWQSYRRHADLRWLEGTAVPTITQLLEQGRPLEALQLYRRAEAVAPNSKLLYKLADGVASHPVRFETTPPGAKIYVSDYKAGLGDDPSQWQLVGTAPATLAEVPIWGYYRLRAIKEGFAPADQVFSGEGATVTVTLHESGTVPQGMVWVPPGPYVHFVVPRASVPGFWIDRFEVTNRQFADFVNAGGYTKKEYWKPPFVKDGRPVAWEEAMLVFHDLTARAGPANWSLGTYPEGAADLPVAGVSWYEAMAYAEFAGKSIPTVYEWRRAAPTEAYSDVVLMSNFSAKALARGGASRGMTSFGAYDMAGNVKEWTVNAAGSRRHALGGAWNEVSAQFFSFEALDPFLRTVSMGLRTVQRLTPPPTATTAAIDIAPSGPARTKRPADDQTYRVLADLHRYERTPLDKNVDRTDDSSPFWIRQTVSFKAAYANERVIAHLFLPKNAKPPFQVVIVLAGFGIHQRTRVEDFGYPFEFLIRSGRAVMIPAFWGTLERGPSEFLLPANEETDRSIKWARDLGRSIDYLQTRPDIDPARLGYYGISWGATHAPRLLAVETRLRAAAMVSGSLMPLAFQAPQVDPWNFAPRDHVPTLMVNGRHDFTFQYDTNVKLLFDTLGAPAADKKLVPFDGGHVNIITRPDLLGEIVTWFDRYLGPVSPGP
jgi:formylglycine-generating enzyme required for sulfatase activity/dienelactone hydrolase